MYELMIAPSWKICLSGTTKTNKHSPMANQSSSLICAVRKFYIHNPNAQPTTIHNSFSTIHSHRIHSTKTMTQKSDFENRGRENLSSTNAHADTDTDTNTNDDADDEGETNNPRKRKKAHKVVMKGSRWDFKKKSEVSSSFSSDEVSHKDSEDDDPDEDSDENSDKEKTNDDNDSGDKNNSGEEQNVEEPVASNSSDSSSELSSSLDEAEIAELGRAARVWEGKQQSIGLRYGKLG